jgi:hypothetical protein
MRRSRVCSAGPPEAQYLRHSTSVNLRLETPLSRGKTRAVERAVPDCPFLSQSGRAAALRRSANPHPRRCCSARTRRAFGGLNFIATRSGTPRRTMLRIAVRRRSCGIRPEQPAAIVAVFHPLSKRVIGREPALGLWHASACRNTRPHRSCVGLQAGCWLMPSGSCRSASDCEPSWPAENLYLRKLGRDRLQETAAVAAASRQR